MTTQDKLQVLAPFYQKHKGDFESIKADALELGIKLSKRSYFRYKKRLSGEAVQELQAPLQEELKLVSQSPVIARTTEDHKRYVLATAQSHTRVHEAFFKTLLMFCERNNATLLVARNGSLDTKDYDPLVRPYLTSKHHELPNNWHFCAELHGIKPSIADPIRGLETYTGIHCCVIPHVKTQLKSVPRRYGYKPKLVYTTGAVTYPNYPSNKSGHIAQFHHTLGALYVEARDNGYCYAYNLLAEDNGSFYHLTEFYSHSGWVSKDGKLRAIKWGDIHVEKLDPDVAKCSWQHSDSILHTLKPQHQFVEDLCDFTARNHHSISNRTRVTENFYAGHNSIADSLRLCSDFLINLQRPLQVGDDIQTRVYVTNANHNNAFQRWLENRDLSFIDPVNEELYFKYNAEILRAIRLGIPYNAFEQAILDVTGYYFKRYIGHAKFLDSKDVVRITDIAMSDHGHLGANGAKGSPNFYAGLIEKNCIAHTHAHYTKNGSTGAGTSSLLDMGYNEGFSSWTHGHTGVYQNGKRVQLIINNGEW